MTLSQVQSAYLNREIRAEAGLTEMKRMFDIHDQGDVIMITSNRVLKCLLFLSSPGCAKQVPSRCNRTSTFYL